MLDSKFFFNFEICTTCGAFCWMVYVLLLAGSVVSLLLFTVAQLYLLYKRRVVLLNISVLASCVRARGRGRRALFFFASHNLVKVLLTRYR